MERLLAVFTALRLMGTGVYQQGRMIAFSVIELLENGYAMGHFAKCDARFSGLSHYLYQATARAASDAAVDTSTCKRTLVLPDCEPSRCCFAPFLS